MESGEKKKKVELLVCVCCCDSGEGGVEWSGLERGVLRRHRRLVGSCMALLRGRVDGLGVSYQVLQRASAIGENKFTQLTMRSGTTI